ncbi:MAG: glycosyltransferase family 4 protein [Candidatus Eisenbacteria bacterium]|nr:glycosyltransferase family 4 protein [Candidatus Eisenbacteria bacterium]
MKRILGLSSIPPEPALGAGGERIREIYRHLPGGEYDGTLLALTGIRDGGGEERIGPLRIARVPSPTQTLFYYLERARVAPFFRVAGWHRRLPLGAASLLNAPFDLAQFDSLWLTPWADRLRPGTPVLYASHNLEADWHKPLILPFPFRKRHARYLADLEKWALRRADRVVAVTEEDREAFLRFAGIPRERIDVIPNGYDPEKFKPSPQEEREAARVSLGLPREGRVALFAGSLVPPNVEAVEAILDRIVPEAPRDIHFLIAGSAGEPFRKRSGGRVLVTGRVDRIEPCFRAADIGLNPILSGSGSNVKVLQYLGAGLAVLSTPFGMRGFGELKRFASVDRIDRFAYLLREAAPDPAATDFVRERYTWARASALLARVHDRLLGRVNEPGEGDGAPAGEE